MYNLIEYVNCPNYQTGFHLQAFEDRVLQGRILYLLGQLSLEEAQYKQAFNLAVEAQVCKPADIPYYTNYEVITLVSYTVNLKWLLMRGGIYTSNAESLKPRKIPPHV